jgi:hypothetical protein
MCMCKCKLAGASCSFSAVGCACASLFRDAQCTCFVGAAERNYNTIELSFCIMQRGGGVHQLKIIMESLCVLLYLLFASLALAAQRQERLPLCISRAKPASINFYSYLICATPRDLILGCGLSKKMCIHIHNTS